MVGELKRRVEANTIELTLQNLRDAVELGEETQPWSILIREAVLHLHPSAEPDMAAELARAEEKFEPMASTHDALAIIAEEVGEAVRLMRADQWMIDAVGEVEWKRRLREEIVQIGAMTMRMEKDAPGFRRS